MPLGLDSRLALAVVPGSTMASSKAFTVLLGLSLTAHAGGCGRAPSGAAPAAAEKARAPDRLVENFEQPSGSSGGFWFEFDKSGLGTVAQPSPFTLEPGGAPQSPGFAAHIWGKLGANRAPWSWVQLQLFLNREKTPEDISAYRSLRFFVKGNGGRYGVALVKASVKNFDHFRYEFSAPAQWTQMHVPLAELQQAGWGEKVPQSFSDVTTIQFYPAEYDKPFDLFVDDVVLSGAEARIEPIAYATRDWFAWSGIDPAKRRGTALDVSHLLDAPAGKHGPVTRQRDQFAIGGKPVRFWGINIVASANFPTHAEAERTAELLAQLGVNMTRHHHMDAAWSRPNVFGNGPSTRELDAGAMERFDYFVNQLQKRGIYQFFDLLVHRKATPADGVAGAEQLASGFKIEGELDPQLIALQERFVDAFMGHHNPYLKTSYAKSPGVALIEVINEDSLFGLQQAGDFAIEAPRHRELLNRLFSDWLKRQVPGGRPELEKRWAAGTAPGLRPEEDPARGNVNAVVSFDGDQLAALSPGRRRDTLRFLYDTQLGYYRRIQARLKALGYRGLVTGSNHWTDHPLDLLANAQLDFVDRHSYWAHPSGGWGYELGVTWDPTSMLKDPNLGIIGSLARRRVKGLPYSTSEWQTSAPNDFRHEGLLLVGAYASLQQFSPLQFAFSHDSNKRVDAPQSITGNFDIIEQPTMLGAWPAVSLLFHRSDVRAAGAEAYLKVDPETAFASGESLAAPAQLGLMVRSGIDFGGGKSPAELEQIRAAHVRGDLVVSATGELRHDAVRGRFELETPRTQGFAGFSDGAPVRFGNLQLELTSPFAVVIVTALERAPITSAKRVLVSALGNAVNTGMTLAPSGNRLVDSGASPILVEPIAGKLTLAQLFGPLDRAKVYALGASGERLSEVPLQAGGGSLSFELSAAHRTMHYEVVRQ